MKRELDKAGIAFAVTLLVGAVSNSGWLLLAGLVITFGIWLLDWPD